MKKLIATIVCLGMVVLGTVGIATAVPITFTDTTYFNESGTDPVDYLEGLGDYVTLTQYFEFDPAAEEVIDEFGSWDLFTWDLVFYFADVGSWDIGGVNYVIDGSNLIDGEFSITLVSIWGDSYIYPPPTCYGYRPPDQCSNHAPVPEPSTVLLVGSGLLGMIAFGRKRFK